MSANKLCNKLMKVTETEYEKLLKISEEESAKKSPPGSWSDKEIIGHLIDSASNNHQRFVRAQFKNDLVFDGYDQDEWVSVQQYQSAPWHSLLRLWYEFNMHLVRVIAAIPNETLLFERTKHNLDEIAWQPVAIDQPVTLDYFIEDYIEHLQHHLKHIV